MTQQFDEGVVLRNGLASLVVGEAT